MTVSSGTSRVSYSGNGSTTVFAYTFKIFANSDLEVYLKDDTTGVATLQTLTTDYTVSNAGNDSGGNVTFVVAPASGKTVIIRREIPYTQETNYVENDPFPAQAHEDALDKLTMLTQQNDRGVDRSIRKPVADAASISMELPKAADRADKLLGFDTNGAPSTVVVTADAQTIAGIAADISTLADIQDGTVATDAITNVNDIRSNVTTVSGIASDVTTVSGNTTNINTVAGDLDGADDIGTVAGSITNVNNVGNNISDVNSVAGISSDVTTVAGVSSNVTTVAGVSTDVTTVAGVSADVTTVAGVSTDVTTVAGVSANVTTVAGIDSDVTTVAGISADVTTVAGIAGDIPTLATNVERSRWQLGKPQTFAASVSGNDITISWSTLRLIDGSTTIRKIKDQAEVTLNNDDALWIDTESVYSDGYTVNSGSFSANYEDFVSGSLLLLVGNYFGIAIGLLSEMIVTQYALDDASDAQTDADAAQTDADAAQANSERARDLVVGDAVTVGRTGGVYVKLTKGQYFEEANGGLPKYKFAEVTETLLPANQGFVVDLDGTPNGDGELVPTLVTIASGVQTGWTTGNKVVLIARDTNGRLFGKYTINKSSGQFDGEANFLLNSGDDLPTWNESTRTLTWPDLLMLRDRGATDENVRIKLEGGSIVVPSGGFQTVVLDLNDVDDTETPNTAVSVGQYIDATPGWDGTVGNYLPLFAVGYGVAYPIRFPPVVGSTPLPAHDYYGGYDPDEVVVDVNSGGVDIYMKGSSPSSDKYIKYEMLNSVNASIGCDVWRLHKAYEATRTGEKSFTEGQDLLNGGENETAIKITGKIDFMGGAAHGDEEKTSVKLLIDGAVQSLTNYTTYRCRKCEFFQTSELFEPHTATPQSTVVAHAYKRWVYEGGELELFQTIDWDAAVTLSQTYLTMLSIYRDDGSVTVTDKGFRSFEYAEEDISTSGFTMTFTDSKIAKASGPDGYSAEVEILEGWDKTNRRFNFSNAAQYNKFYFDFTGSSYTTTIGETFNARSRYKLITSN